MFKPNTTGGLLNTLNGKYGISSPTRSVPVMKLIRTHKPQSHKELSTLINSHVGSECECECGIKSKGTIKDFGTSLYNAQAKEWGEDRFTLDE